MSAAFVDVEPPSSPIKPLTTSPGLNVAGVNFGILYLSLKVSSSASSLYRPPPPESFISFFFSSALPTLI